MSKYGIITIGLLYLVYGAVRLVVASMMLLQIAGAIDLPDLREGLIEVANFFESKNNQAIMSISPLGYISYLWVMGVLLVIGGIGCLTKKAYGHISISIFLLLYALLFVNFLTINPKIIHLIICAVLLIIYLWFRKKDSLNLARGTAKT